MIFLLSLFAAAPKPVVTPTLWDRVWDITEVPARIIGLLVFAFLLRWVLFRFINRLTATAADMSQPKRVLGSKKAAKLLVKNGLISPRQAQRAQALASLFKSMVTGIIGVIVLGMILGLLGYNLAPFIASAGVVGVALGFGAQSLVKDLVSGVFMLLEDQFGVGDVIDMDKASGTVEAVGLRVTRLRDAEGVVWHVRNGEVLRVGNKSMGWSALTVDVDVAYDEDLERVQVLIDLVGQELAQDEDWRDEIIEAPKAIGVQAITSSAVTIRIFGQCKPSEKVAVERALRLRIKASFDEAEVRLPTTA